MFNKETEAKIKEAIKLEYENAVINYGTKYHTLHEAYAVLLEEVEEAHQDMTFIYDHLKTAWEEIKADNELAALEEIRMIWLLVRELAKEAVQVAAVAQKIIGDDK